MAQIITTTPDPQNPDGPTRVVRLNDANRTEQQVRILCSLIAQVEKPLWGFIEPGEQIHVEPRMLEAALSTYELACGQLRNIVDDMARWSHRDSDNDRYVERLAEANLKVAEAQSRVIAERSRPSFALGARVRKVQRADTNELTWIAYLGSEPTADGLIGVGPSPEAALIAFDHAYTTAIEQQPQEPTKAPARRTRRKKK